MSSGGLVLSGRDADGAVAVLTLNRPPVHALSLEMWETIEQTFAAAADDRQVKVVVLTATGRKAFCGGADVNDFVGLTPETRLERQSAVNRILNGLSNFPVPIVAAINGPVVGGGLNLASVCDIRIATSTAHFSLPEIRRGAAGGGGSFLRRTGMPEGIIRHMLYTGRRFSASEMHRAFFVDAVVTESALMPTAMAIAADIAAQDRDSLVLMKRAVLVAEREVHDWLRAYKSTGVITAEMTGLDASKEGIQEFLTSHRE
jgi:enoyl-CoA hydratase/carnithine racemase